MNKHITRKTKKNKNRISAFTLIELLAVIIILGIIAVIAIPAVTRDINDTKKSSYVSSAKSLISGATTLANSETLDIKDKKTTYYIPVKYINTNNNHKSPYGEFTEAYIGITVNDEGYSYYWISRDSEGVGVKDIVLLNNLDVDNIEENIEENEITNKVKTKGIGNRANIKVLNQEGEWDNYTVLDTINNYLENGNLPNISYPSGKTKATVVRGDLITIGTEDFYVVKHDGNNNLILFAKYNLKVGNIYEYTTKLVKVGEYSESDPGYGMQSSEAMAHRARKSAFKGGITFSKKAYWEKEGITHPIEIYGDSSNVKKYVDNYVKKLEVVVKESRLLKGSEAVELGCNLSSRSCSSAPSFVRTSSYWLNSSYAANSVLSFMYENGIITNSYYQDSSYGVRPVIII